MAHGLWKKPGAISHQPSKVELEHELYQPRLQNLRRPQPRRTERIVLRDHRRSIEQIVDVDDALHAPPLRELHRLRHPNITERALTRGARGEVRARLEGDETEIAYRIAVVRPLAARAQPALNDQSPRQSRVHRDVDAVEHVFLRPEMIRFLDEAEALTE